LGVAVANPGAASVANPGAASVTRIPLQIARFCLPKWQDR
jgi:hypothetical protein